MPEASDQYDVFVSHAHEDKIEVAQPLALTLRRRGLRVWYDEFSLRLGDSLRKSIEHGLATSRFGVVILSPHFFAKKWTEKELSGLWSKQVAGERSVIIPVLHNITHGEVRDKTPMLADIVAVPTSIGLPEVVARILTELNFTPSEIDLARIAPTGISRLDQATRGGFPRGSSVVIKGPKGVGKTTLGIHIQMAALDRGEPCLYITYREPPHDILTYMLRIGAPVEDYVRAGTFKVFDNFSARYGLSQEEVEAPLSDVLRAGIVRVENPDDAETYYALQVELMEQMGTGGINVIDSTNDRYDMLKKAGNASDSARAYFQRFRTKLARLGSQGGLHIVSEQPEDEGFAELLSDLEDGVILLKYVEAEGDRRRYLRIESLRGTWHNDAWLEFVIGSHGIEVF